MFRTLFGLASVFVIPIFAMAGSSAFADPPHTNCNTLQAAIDAASDGDVIKVKGHCNGHSYVIATNGLTLSGQGFAKITGDGTAPAITVTGHRVTIEDWDEIDGGAADGVYVSEAGSVVLSGISLIKGEDGVVVSDAAFVSLFDSNIVGATDDGFVALLNGSARISDTDISDNGQDGVLVVSGGAVFLLGGNSINNNGRNGLLAGAGNVDFSGANTVQNNAANDVFCNAHSRVLVVNSITSTSKNTLARDCSVIELGNADLFEDLPFNLVDCDAVPPIGQTIDQTIRNGVTNIVVRGLCDETVFNRTSNITIRGENPGDGIQTNNSSGVFLTGAVNVNLQNLTISASVIPVQVGTNSTASISDSELTGNTDGQPALFVSEHSIATVFNSTLNRGITASGRSLVTLIESDLTANGHPSFNSPMVLFSSEALVEATDFTGGELLVSQLSVLDFRAGIVPSNIAATVPTMAIRCFGFSTVRQIPTGIVENGLGVALGAGAIEDSNTCEVVNF